MSLDPYPRQQDHREGGRRELLEEVLDASRAIQESARTATEQLARAEIDIQIATAKRYPRSLEDFFRRAKMMIGANIDTAASMTFNRPGGRDEESGGQKTIAGPSIRMAEIVAACYGNLFVSSSVVEMTERYVRVRARAHDMETNNAVAQDVIESTVNKYGKPYSERHRATMSAAAQSKARRNAIFSVVPRALCAQLVEFADQVVKGVLKTLDERRSYVLKYFSQWPRFDMARVWAVLGVQGPADLSDEHLNELRSILQSIKDGDTTMEAAFPHVSDEKLRPVTGQQAAINLADSILGPMPAAATAATTPTVTRCAWSGCGEIISGAPPFMAAGLAFCNREHAAASMP